MFLELKYFCFVCRCRAFNNFMICSELCTFFAMLTMCVLYVSVTPNILGVYSWVVLCCLFVGVFWCYILQDLV